LFLEGGIIVGFCLLCLTAVFAPQSSQRVLHLSTVLGMTESGVVMARAELLPEKPPVPNPAPGDHPGYALLHPETPPMLMPEKGASPPSPPRKPKVKQVAAGAGPKGGASAKPTAKEKPANKVRAKKKRPKNTKPNLMRQASLTILR
jgi:hypothetical protein